MYPYLTSAVLKNISSEARLNIKIATDAQRIILVSLLFRKQESL